MRIGPAIRAQPVGDDALLAQEPRALDGVAADAAPGDREGRARALELAEREPHVAECLGREHDRLGAGAAPLRCRLRPRARAPRAASTLA